MDFIKKNLLQIVLIATGVLTMLFGIGAFIGNGFISVNLYDGLFSFSSIFNIMKSDVIGGIIYLLRIPVLVLAIVCIIIGVLGFFGKAKGVKLARMILIITAVIEIVLVILLIAKSAMGWASIVIAIITIAATVTAYLAVKGE